MDKLFYIYTAMYVSVLSDYNPETKHKPFHNNFLISLSTVVLNSRDRQGMYGMQHFRAPINKPHNNL